MITISFILFYIKLLEAETVISQVEPFTSAGTPKYVEWNSLH